jgi:cell division GTPase FtsZ
LTELHWQCCFLSRNRAIFRCNFAMDGIDMFEFDGELTEKCVIKVLGIGSKGGKVVERMVGSMADIKQVLKDHDTVCMSIGLSGVGERGSKSAARALRGLAIQDVDAANADGILVSIMGSANMTMDDFDQASWVLRGSIPEERNTVCGCYVDDAFGDNTRVTVFASVSGRP